MVLRLLGSQVVEHRFGHAGVEFPRSKPVSPANHQRHGVSLDATFNHRFSDGVLYIEIQRLTRSSRFLGAIKYGYRSYGLRQSSHKSGTVKGTVEANLDQSYPLPLADQVFNYLMHRVGARAHHHRYPLGVGRTDIVEEVILTSDDLGEAIHRPLYDARGLYIVWVDRLAGGKEYIWILGRTTDDGPVRRETPHAVSNYPFLIDHRSHVIIGQLLDFLDLVGSAETIEEMKKGDARFQRRSLGNQGEVHDLLDVIGGQLPPASRTGSHHIAMVTKDR